MSAPSTKNVLIALVALGGLIAGYYLMQGSEAPADRSMMGARVVPVRTATVVMDEFYDSIEAVGTASSNESTIISAKVTEKLTRLNFEDGQSIQEGDIIAELTDVEATADLAEARATLLEAQQQYDRIEGLFQRGNTTKASLDQAKSALDRAQARVEGVEARVADRLIRAPFSGVLGLRMVSPGTLVRPGDEITTLDDISLIKLDFSVPETFISALKPGLDVTAQSAAYPERHFVGEIKAIGTRVDPTTRAVMVRAEIPNPDLLLKPGMLMTTLVVQNQRQSMMLPERALNPLKNENFVFVVRDQEGKSIIDMVRVEIKGRRPGFVEILSGVELGDQVVVEGTNRVRPGAEVRVLPAAGEGGRPNA